MMEPEEIKASIKEAAKHKTRRKSVQRVLADLDGKAKRLARSIEDG